MVQYVRTSDQFGVITRNVRADGFWPGDTDGEPPAYRLAGPVVLDVYNELRAWNQEDLVGRLTDEAMVAGVLLSGWRQEELRAFRSAAWRSAHRFLVNNVGVVDRGRELDEVAKIMGVAR